MIELLLEIENDTRKQFFNEDEKDEFEPVTLEDNVTTYEEEINCNGCCKKINVLQVGYVNFVKEATEEIPYFLDFDSEKWGELDEYELKYWDYTKYTNDYIISNDNTVRYDWDIVENILGENKIPFKIGCSD